MVNSPGCSNATEGSITSTYGEKRDDRVRTNETTRKEVNTKMVTKVPKTKVFGGTRYRLSTVPGSRNTEDEAKSLARECRDTVEGSIRT